MVKRNQESIQLNKQKTPIKLVDLLPRENVKGGKGKTVFGALRDLDRKQNRFS